MKLALIGKSAHRQQPHVGGIVEPLHINVRNAAHMGNRLDHTAEVRSAMALENHSDCDLACHVQPPTTKGASVTQAVYYD